MNIFLIPGLLILAYSVLIYLLLVKFYKGLDFIVVDYLGADRRKGTANSRKAYLDQLLLIKWVAFVCLVIVSFLAFGLGAWLIITHAENKDMITTGAVIAGGAVMTGTFLWLFRKASRDAEDAR
jgi:hypothetical protein